MERISLFHPDFGETYRFAEPHIHEKYNDLAVIPEFTNYGVSKDGLTILRLSDGYRMSIRGFTTKDRYFPEENRYQHTDLTNDKGENVTCPIHRLVMLAWSSYDFHLKSMTVDHLDTLKFNNTLENLEWVTKEENSRRAWRMGLNDDSKQPIDFNNWKTGVSGQVESQTNASVLTGLSIDQIRWRVRSSGKLRFEDGWRFKYPGDSWVMLSAQYSVTTVPRLLYGRYVGDYDRSVSFESTGDVFRRLGILSPIVEEHCRKNVLTPYRGWLFRRDPDGFPFIPELQKEFFLKIKDIPRSSGRPFGGLVLFNEDGSVAFVGRKIDMMEHLSISKVSELDRLIKTRIGVGGRIKLIPPDCVLSEEICYI